MKARKDKKLYSQARYLSIEELVAYTSLGRNTAREIGVKSGAAIKIGRRAIYDREKIDTYLESIGTGRQE